jgi:acetyl-CoA C-acetyltransferase
MVVDKVAIIGAGLTRFHHSLHLGKSTRELFVEAFLESFESVDKGINHKDIEALFVGNTVNEFFEHQSHLSSLLADWSGLLPVPSTRVETACASSSTALEMGTLAIASGMYDIVLVGGVEKMSSLPTDEMTWALMSGMDQAYECPLGVSNPALYAMMAMAHFQKYGSTWEQLTSISIKNHHNASLNPKAQYQSEIIDIAKKIAQKKGLSFKDEMDFLESPSNPYVSYPLRLFDCSPISDGASTVILASKEKAKNFTDTPIYISGLGHKSGTMSLHDRNDLTSIPSAVEAGKSAYKMANIEPKDIDVAMVHDCFTPAEMIAIEDLGFFEKGEGARASEEGRTSLSGEIPINTDGGLKAKGHPIAATGSAMAHEIWKQLRGEAEKRQVPNAEIGLIHNIGATGGTSVVQIFKR